MDEFKKAAWDFLPIAVLSFVGGFMAHVAWDAGLSGFVANLAAKVCF